MGLPVRQTPQRARLGLTGRARADRLDHVKVAKQPPVRPTGLKN